MNFKKAIIAVTAMLLLAGCARTIKLQPETESLLYGRQLAIASNTQKNYRLVKNSTPTVVTSPNPIAGLAATLVVAAIDHGVKKASGAYDRVLNAPEPTIDPSKTTAKYVSGHLVSNYKMRRARPIKGASLNNIDTKKRAKALTNNAKTAGYNGLILDVLTVDNQGLMVGSNLAIGGLQIKQSYEARVSLIDAKTGDILASKTCIQGTKRPDSNIKRFEEGGVKYANRMLNNLADQCAQSVIKWAL
ncbi:hypothetical protein [Flexibacterium corallicola]|uniref:hypothetical protein n=1 Tax=Flexibacterium corallicola TaxID=3037259 RepID=UPI00286F0EB8|nr:hypothetical protein [Pseudovibrio sp. M1P-2-3]